MLCLLLRVGLVNGVLDRESACLSLLPAQPLLQVCGPASSEGSLRITGELAKSRVLGTVAELLMGRRGPMRLHVMDTSGDSQMHRS